MKIAVGADHAGYELKQVIVEHLTARGYEVVDYGTDTDASTDYPDHGAPAAKAAVSGDADRAILFCGSGQGMCMVANKVRGARAALAWNREIARLSRAHNDANVLCLPGRYVAPDEAVDIVDVWLAEGYEGGRHDRRIAKMMQLEEG
ncbi:ribose 5-phosphate isomerase B [bacterium]|nr:ribose 5-phosphate isomerase B [bacterium]